MVHQSHISPPLLLLLGLAACGPTSKQSAEKPAKLEVIGHESELLKLTLTPAAETRLGIQTMAVGSGSASRGVTTHGEIVVPAAAGGVPTSAQTDLAALAGNQVQAEGAIARARAELAIAQTAAVRAAALVREEAGSVRASDEAQSAVVVARGNLRTAQAQRAMLGASPAALGRQGILWVRVATFAGDLASIDRSAPAQVRALGSPAPAIAAAPVAAPPSANASAGTVDLCYAFPNRGGVFGFALVDLSEITERVGEAFAPDVEAAGHGFELQTEPGIIVEGDRHLLSQMLIDLIENGVRHTPAGSTVRVALRREGGGALLSVADNGPGVPAADRERILRRFARLEQSRSTPGYGLGLSLVSAVVRAHLAALSVSDNMPGLRIEIRFDLVGD